MLLYGVAEEALPTGVQLSAVERHVGHCSNYDECTVHCVAMTSVEVAANVGPQSGQARSEQGRLSLKSST